MHKDLQTEAVYKCGGFGRSVTFNGRLSLGRGRCSSMYSGNGDLNFTAQFDYQRNKEGKLRPWIFQWCVHEQEAELRERRQNILDSIRETAFDITSLSDGYFLPALPPQLKSLANYLRLIDLERQCCQFLKLQRSL